MAGDVPADVGVRHSGLATEHRDDRVLDVAGGDAAGPDGEQQLDVLAGAAVGELRLVRADGLPGVDGLAEDRVDRHGEGGAGLVSRDVEQADRVARQYLLRVAGNGCAVVPGSGLRKIRGIEVETGPQQLRPDLVGDHPRVGAEEGGDAARDRQSA